MTEKAERYMEEMRVSEVLKFVVDATAERVETTNPNEMLLPGVVIVISEHVLASTGKALRYSADASFYTGRGDFEAPDSFIGQCHYETASDCLRAYLSWARGVAAKRYRKLANDGGDVSAIEKMLCALKDQGEIALGELDEGTVDFKWLDGSDLALACRVIVEHFPDLLTEAIISFRLRSADKPWTSGRDRSGCPVVRLGEVKKVAPEQRAWLREALGYGPHFIVTVNAEEFFYCREDARKAALIHHLLCACGWDNEKNSPFVAAADFEGYGETLKAFGLHDVRTLNIAHDVIEGARIHNQLDLFGLAEADKAEDVLEVKEKSFA